MLGPMSSTVPDALAKLQSSIVMNDWSMSPLPSSMWFVPPTSDNDCSRQRQTDGFTKIGELGLSCLIIVFPPSPINALLVVLIGPLMM